MCDHILIRNIVETALVHSAAGFVYSTSCAFLHMLFLLQICKQNCSEVDVKPISGCVRNAVVPSYCDMSGTSCYHLVTKLMMVTDLLQVVPT